MRPEELMQSSRAADTMSETSEGTATTSVSGKSEFYSREELKDLAASLGIADPEDLHQDRFRIDRRKLEQMLIGDNEAPESAETFFRNIMGETNTNITWPCRLKIGAKSKKDPHIKVAGRQDDVKAAKEKIMQVLDTRQSNRVTMKLDVSYNDHSHIIGKGGLTIKKVMEETRCHIHFPDSNRNNAQEKSNQVSIAGEMDGVERARARVRNLTPLIFSFELPIMGSMQAPPDSTSPYVVKIQEKYNVQVMFRTRPKLHATLVIVKGCEWEVSQVKEATLLLIRHMCENLANQIQVQMSVQISPQHHTIVLGKHSCNLKMIMQRTGTQIMFPDAGDPNIPTLKKSNVTITGGVHNVYLARQQLIGSLPLVLMFDLPEDSMSSVDTENISQLMQSLDVFINVRYKPKQSTLSVIIKGIERNASNIYEARKQLLGLAEPRVHAEIPATYHVPNATNVFTGNAMSNGAGSSNVNSLTENFPNLLTINTANGPYPMSPLQHSPNPAMGLAQQWGLPPLTPMFSPLPAHHHTTFSYPHLNHLLAQQHLMHMGANNLLPQHQGMVNTSTANNVTQGHHGTGFNGTGNNMGNSMGGSMHSSGYHTLNTTSLVDHKYTSACSSLSSLASSLSSPAISPRNASPVNLPEPGPNLDLSSMLSDLSDRRAPGCEKKTLEMVAQSNLTPFDYEQKKIMGVQAIQSKPSASDYRVPTSAWAGLGLSQTVAMMQSENNQNGDAPFSPSDLWNEPTTPVFNTTMDFGTPGSAGKERIGMASNYMDHTPTSQVNKIVSQRYSDLASMLTNIGLEKYIRLFTSHEVDMATFSSLTEKDLYEIGVTAWGARRKIMLMISEINKRSSPFSGSAAPGAERKTSAVGSTSVSKCVLENW
ncbi:protein bicaudal C isoform X1 [Athalia rosae]|uniref:protein bicaudal C isoform X1 n=1 Tax=Athalia rosae TaxID=37344 RepID=UPI002033F0A7|nr:protein bicaudal C isoform X1 [Athalia rosae]XP_012263435.2 protein bicaudal C isoform X1 [Athalia rosae]XP_020710464.2 protein bicaudal C isoform X1 [Athalia rosae]XP_020710465.2 protein bicaudal C isoform X1 [Athalia rosae]XP_048510881.1 protein bicaudal C isoform X1 [Athalia rosae]